MTIDDLISFIYNKEEDEVIKAIHEYLRIHGATMVDCLYKKHQPTALMVVAFKGYTRAAGLLLDNGASVNFKRYISRETPLIWAIRSAASSESMVELLLKRHAELDIEDASGYTALGWAINHNYVSSVVRLLINQGADIEKGLKYSNVEFSLNDSSRMYYKKLDYSSNVLEDYIVVRYQKVIQAAIRQTLLARLRLSTLLAPVLSEIVISYIGDKAPPILFSPLADQAKTGALPVPVNSGTLALQYCMTKK